MSTEENTAFAALPVELVERIAWFLPLTALKTFRSTDGKCAAAGLKPLLEFVPRAVNASMLELPGRVLNRDLDQLVDIATTPSISKVITSLTVGRGATRLELLSTIHLPNLLSFRLRQIEIDSAKYITTFLSGHENSLRSVELNKVDIICPLTEGSRNEILPMEWRDILTTIRGLPHLSELLVSDLGYYNAERDMTYRIWIDPAQIRENASLRCEEAGNCDVVIRATGAQARAKDAVDKAIDAVMLSTGKKVLKFRIGV